MRNLGRWVFVAALAAACVEQPAPRGGARGASQQEVEAIRRRVASRTAPTPQHPLRVNFDNKVELLGYDINLPGRTLRPGQSVTIKWYWHARAQVPEGWRLFTHLDDAEAPRTNQDNVGDVRRGYQPERWRPGEYITDEQTFELPADWSSPVVRVNVGLWKGDQRMPATPAERTDGARRVRAIELDTGVSIPVAEMTVPHATGPITIDGTLEDAWQRAQQTGPLVNTMTGAAPGQTEAQANARLLWDEQNLYVAFTVRDDNLVDPATARDNHLWEHDAVEVMIDPNGDGRNYFELQVSPRNQRFDTRYDAARQPAAPGHVDWNPETSTAVHVEGTIGNADDTDREYTVEMAIPWTSLTDGGLAHVPPQPGDQLRINFFVMDEPKSGGQRFAAWSAPRRGDFHALDRFGRITLAPAAAPAPAPTPGAAPAAPAAPTAAPSQPHAALQPSTALPPNAAFGPGTRVVAVPSAHGGAPTPILVEAAGIQAIAGRPPTPAEAARRHD